MHKLFWTDCVLVFLTLCGVSYLYSAESISFIYASTILGTYLLAKILGYLILPYAKFEIFIQHLINTSKLKNLSGFEIFKTSLVTLLFLGFIFINPAIWIIESILVVVMRIWGIAFIKDITND